MSHAQRANVKNDEDAVAPVIGAVLIILLTFVLVGVTVATLYDSDAVQRLDNAFADTPMAVIEIEGVEGHPDVVPFRKTYIRLFHKGGNSLTLDSTSIVLYGEGGTYVGPICENGSHTEKGDLVVKYVDLAPDDKNITFTQNNPILDDNLWSTGEQIILWGRDSSTGNVPSSVLAIINGINSSYDNYGFKAGSTVTVKIFDKRSGCIIAEDTAIVQPVE